MRPYLTSQPLSYEVKDIDEKGMRVKIRVAAFGNRDSDGDIIIPGAFQKTISERGPSGTNRIKHLNQHNPNEPVGMPEEVKEVAEGLDVVSRVSDSTRGRDIIADYKINMYEHSIGFEIIDSEMKDDGTRIIKEIKLWEYSNVTWGANPETPFQGFKSLLEGPDALEKVNTRMERLIKSLVKGEHTEERLECYQIELKQLQTLYNGLIGSSEEDTSRPLEKSTSLTEVFAETFYKNYNND